MSSLLSRAEMPEVSWLQKPWVPPALACGLVFLTYAGAVRFDFVYDDTTQILQNPWLTSFSYLPRYFTSHVWAFANIAGAYWRPLFLIWLLLHRILFGVHPAMWHLDSVLLHVAATGCVYLLARRLTRDRAAGLIAALIFGLHPALIESVAWISGVTDPLLAVCLVPAFLAFLNWRESRSSRWLAVSLVLYALALMSKEPAIVLGPLIFAYVWIYSDRQLTIRDASSAAVPPQIFAQVWFYPNCQLISRIRDAFGAVVPYIPATIIYLAIHLLLLRDVDYSRSLATPARTLLTAPSLLLFYLRILVFPAVISPHYNFKLVTAFSASRVLVPCLVLIAAAVLLYLSVRGDRDRSRLTAFAGAWILLPLLPAFYLAPQGPHDFAHARYLYLPCIGFGIIVAAAIRRLRVPAVQAAAAGAIVILLAVGTAAQQLYWSNDITLFTHAVAVAPDNPTALTGLGIETGKRGRYAEAINLFQRALAIDPGDWHPNFSLGYTYFILGRYAEAERLIARAVAINPWGADPDQYAYLGLVESKLGDLPKAERAVREAARRQPNREQFHFALALILEQEGKLPDAVKELKETLTINPNNAAARARLNRIESVVDRR
jgi:protein O-mannosyl-transferase